MKTVQNNNTHYQQHSQGHAAYHPNQMYAHQEQYEEDEQQYEEQGEGEYQQEEQAQLSAQEASSTHLSPVNQQILQRLKQQQASRIQERRMYEEAAISQSSNSNALLTKAAGVSLSGSASTSNPKNQAAAGAVEIHAGVAVNASSHLVPASGQFIRQAQQSQQHDESRKSAAAQNKHSQSTSSMHSNVNSQKTPAATNNAHLLNSSPSKPQSTAANSKEHLLVMTIDLGEGHCDVLHIFEADDPLVVAEQFCSKNNLTSEAMAILAKNIEANKQIVLTERQHQLYHLTRSVSPPAKQFTQSNNYYAQQPNPYSAQQQQQLQQQLLQQQQQQNSFTQHPDDVRNNYYKTTPLNMNEQFEHQQLQHSDNAYSPQEQGSFVNAAASHNSSQHHGDRRSGNNLHGNQEQEEDDEVVIPQGKQTIFERLHAEAALKEQRRENRRKQEENITVNTSTRSVKKFIGQTELNLGEYLYHKGQQMKSSKQQNTEEYIMLQMEKEKLYPFRPEINENSERICMAKRNEYGEATEDHLLKQGKLYKEKKDMKKSSRESEQYEECTFKPQLNQVSEHLVEVKKAKMNMSDAGKFEELHEESIRRNQRKQERSRYTDYSFHPKINRPPKNNENIPFVERMMKSVNDKERKHQELRVKQKLEDEEKNESTFTPAIGRAPRERNSQGLPVHEYLYNQNEEKRMKHEVLLLEEKERQKASKAKTLEASSQIVERIERERFEELFNQLDNDGDGEISSSNIDISQIPNEIIEFIAPMLLELQQNDLTIRLKDFYPYMAMSVKNLNIAQRNELFHSAKWKWEEKRSKFSQFDYKPAINERSSRLASKRSPDKIKRLYDNGMEKKKEQQIKLSAIKKEQETKELEQCTFKPELQPIMNIYPFNDSRIQKQNSHFFGAQNAFDLGDGQFRVTGVVPHAPSTHSLQ